MTTRNEDRLPGSALAQLLGVSDEMASTFVADGHVILTEEKKHTFLRLHDIYQGLRKSSVSRATRAIV